MSFIKRFSRRDLIGGGICLLGGGAAFAAALGKQSAAPQLNNGLTAAGRVISIVAPSDPSYGQRFAQLFPNANQVPALSQVGKAAYLISNVSGPPIRAVSLIWTFTSPGGVYQAARFSYRRFDLDNTVMSAQRPFLSSGQTRLITPLFSWTPEGFQSKSEADRSDVSEDGHLHEFLTQQIVNSSSINLQLDAAVYRDSKLVGQDTTGLANHIRIRRNAEHDEALAILKLSQAGQPSYAVANTLRLHRTIDGIAGAPVQRYNSRPYLYLRSRAYLAQKLSVLFRQTDQATFTGALTGIRNQPKTIIHTLA